MKFIVEKSEAGERLDTFLAKKLPEYSRSYFDRLIRAEHVFINDKATKPSYHVKADDDILVELIETAEIDLKPENIDLNILYEDDDVIVINKQAGLVVHPASGNYSGTLINALLYHFPNIHKAVAKEGSELSKIRPGLVHRLDKDTSGVMIIAKNSRAMHSLSRQIQHRDVEKKYLAICVGWPKAESGELRNFLGRHSKDRKIFAEVDIAKGREAISHYKVLKYLENGHDKISLIEFDIKTGRTHQIRVQSKLINHPVIGDMTYSTKESLVIAQKYETVRQLLHAFSLKITLPSEKKARTFSVDPPADFNMFLSKFQEL